MTHDDIVVLLENKALSHLDVANSLAIVAMPLKATKSERAKLEQLIDELTALYQEIAIRKRKRDT